MTTDTVVMEQVQNFYATKISAINPENALSGNVKALASLVYAFSEASSSGDEKIAVGVALEAKVVELQTSSLATKWRDALTLLSQAADDLKKKSSVHSFVLPGLDTLSRGSWFPK